MQKGFTQLGLRWAWMKRKAKVGSDLTPEPSAFRSCLEDRFHRATTDFAVLVQEINDDVLNHNIGRRKKDNGIEERAI